MKWLSGWGRRIVAMSGNNGGPWGSPPSGGSGGSGGNDGGSGGGGSDGGDGGGPRNPWGRPSGGGGGPRRRRPGNDENVTSLDDWLKRSRERLRGGLPGGGGGVKRSYWIYGLVAAVVLWIAFTSIHPVATGSRGVVTTFGRYDRTMNPGVGFTFPAPISRVEMIQVEEIREVSIPGGENQENLILTGDQNVIDLAYTVRWNIKNPQLYLFQMRDPDQTIREVAETSMRAAVARVSLEDSLGAGRGAIEARVQETMQQLLDEYGSGIQIQGVAINQSQPPTAVNDAFNEVLAAQQEAQSKQNEARAYALQRTAQAQGDAATFEQLYQQYRLAPDVTRRRMYYETMEEILRTVDTTIIEAPGVTPYLPLPEIRNRAQRSQPQAQPQASQGQAR